MLFHVPKSDWALHQACRFCCVRAFVYADVCFLSMPRATQTWGVEESLRNGFSNTQAAPILQRRCPILLYLPSWKYFQNKNNTVTIRLSHCVYIFFCIHSHTQKHKLEATHYLPSPGWITGIPPLLFWFLFVGSLSSRELI